MTVPRVEFFDDVLTVKRPLIYLPEKELARYGRVVGFPDSPACPQGLLSRRAHTDLIMGRFDGDQIQIRASMWLAARRVRRI